MEIALRLRPDLVLVKLAPAPTLSAAGLVLSAVRPGPVCYGRAVQVGERVRDVRIGDVVTFESTAGDPLDGWFLTPHLLIAEQHITAILEPTKVSPHV